MVRKASLPVYCFGRESRTNAGFPQARAKLETGKKLGPDRDGRQKKAYRRRSCGSFHQCAKHYGLRNRTNDEHSSCSVLESSASARVSWRETELLNFNQFVVECFYRVGECRMSDAEEFWRNAAEAQRMAENSCNPQDKAAWLRLAEQWLRLLSGPASAEATHSGQASWTDLNSQQ